MSPQAESPILAPGPPLPEEAVFHAMSVGPITDLVPLDRAAIEQGIPARFTSIVAVHGNRPALITPERSWSYAELDRWSARLAAEIVRITGEVSEPVVQLFHQGPSWVAATLGVLKAGKFYVPLEPSAPLARNQEMLARSGARLLFTERRLHSEAVALAGPGTRVLYLEDVPEDAKVLDQPLPIDRNDPAYIYFTSGTTGGPKGVVDSHRNVLHNIHRYAQALEVTPADRLTVVQSPSFSGTVSSVFTALLNGAALLPFDLREEGFARLAENVKRSRATIFHAVPSIFRGLVEAGERFPDVRIVRIEGDGATAQDQALFRSAFSPGTVLAHGLGATETGLSRQLRLKSGNAAITDRIPIGYALPDMDVRIVDEAGDELPSGSIGEIEVRSEFLATGYWHDPELTRTRFISDPDDALRRRYRTGDLGLMRSDGCIEHLGRRDLEHRINGQWVSTAEVECALMSIGAFNQALAVTRNDTGEPRLVAYVMLADGAQEDPANWRNKLAPLLPGHMVPWAFVTLTEWPVNEHGKVDRKALPAPTIVERIAKGIPRTDAERRMVAIWEDVLQVRPIGTEDGFFALGGDSLRAALLAAKLERWFARPISPALLLSASTVSELLRALELQRVPQGSASPIRALRATGSRPPFFFIDWPGGYGWQFADTTRLLDEDQPVYVITSGGLPEPWQEGTTVEDMAEACLRLMRAVQPDGPLRIGGNCYGGIIALETAQRMRARKEETALLVLFDVSPKDFPDLVPEEACARYRGFELRERDARTRAKREQFGWMAVVRSTLYRARMKLVHLWKGFRGRSMKGRTGAAIDNIYLARELAQDRYTARKWPGRMVLFLSADQLREYTEAPMATFAGLADRIEIRSTTGDGGDPFSEGTAEELARSLKSELDGSAR